MKIRIAVLALIAALGCTAVAVAATNTLTGAMNRDPGSKISIKVKTNKSGVATKITSFKLTNATTLCADEVPGPKVTAQLGTFKIKKLKSSDGKPYLSFTGKARLNGLPHSVQGSFYTLKGKKVEGIISATSRSQDSCYIARGFKAKK